jgi:hypothetical protein
MQNLERSFSNMELGSVPILQPTYVGHIESEIDVFTVISACLSGKLSLVPRLPYAREKDEVVRNGNIYVYSDVCTGQGEWEDGKEWSEGQRMHGLLVQNHSSDEEGFIKISGIYNVNGVVHRLISYREVKEGFFTPLITEHGKSIVLTTPSRDDRFWTDLVCLGFVGFRSQPHSRRLRST